MHRLSGSILVIIAAIAFGFMGLFGSWATNDGVSVEMMLFLRFAIAGAVMAIVMVLMRLRWPRGCVLLGLIGMGAVLYVGEAMFFFHSGRHIPYGLVSLLLYIYPVFVTVYAWLVLKEPLSRSRMIALASAIAGLALTIGPMVFVEDKSPTAGANPLLGVAYGLACCLSYSIYILVGGAMTKKAGAIPAATIVILSAAAVLGLLSFLRHDSFPSTASAWTGIVSLAVASTVLAITAVLVGLARIGPVQTSTLSTLEPVTTVLVGVALMKQPLHWIQLCGGALIVVAAVIVARTTTNASSAEIGEIH